MKVKEESEKVGLKLNIQKTKIMAPSPIIPWQIGSETMDTVRDFILLGSKITPEGDWSHEIKRHLLLGSGEGNGTPLQYSLHSNTLAWKIPWTEEPGRLWSMG